MILISSDFSELAAVCTRVIGIREGRVTGSVEGTELSEAALVRLAYAPVGQAEASMFAAVEGTAGR